MAIRYPAAQVVSLGQGLGLVPMTEKLFDEFGPSEIHEDLRGFVLMTTETEEKILQFYPLGQVAYIEADYFSGEGLQSVILWDNGSRSEMHSETENAINTVLKKLGIRKDAGRDEFNALNLGRHRDTYDWLEIK